MANLFTKTQLASGLFGGGSSNESTPPLTRTSATAITDSDGGHVIIQFEDGEQIEVETLCSVNAGDEVSVLIQNGTPIVSGVVGWGDEVQQTATGAAQTAQDAQDAATQAEQTATQAQETATDAQTAAQNAQNAAEQAAKSATDYMAYDNGILTIAADAQSAQTQACIKLDANSKTVSIHDGTAESAVFGADLIELGKNNDNAVISLCGDSGRIKLTEEESFELQSLESPILDIESPVIRMISHNALNERIKHMSYAISSGDSVSIFAETTNVSAGTIVGNSDISIWGNGNIDISSSNYCHLHVYSTGDSSSIKLGNNAVAVYAFDILNNRGSFTFNDDNVLTANIAKVWATANRSLSNTSGVWSVCNMQTPNSFVIGSSDILSIQSSNQIKINKAGYYRLSLGARANGTANLTFGFGIKASTISGYLCQAVDYINTTPYFLTPTPQIYYLAANTVLQPYARTSAACTVYGSDAEQYTFMQAEFICE